VVGLGNFSVKFSISIRTAGKRKVLTLNDRHEAIKLMESGLVALRFSIGKTQVTNDIEKISRHP
jgi:hypothetical protein